MSSHRIGRQRLIIIMLSLVFMLPGLVSCQNEGIPVLDTSVAPQSPSKPSDYPQAEITFQVKLTASLHEGEKLFLEILDEVTGLALNAARVEMVSEDQQTFVVKLPVVVGSVLKYRYVRDQEPVGIEYTSAGRQVRYRMYLVDGPGTVRDTVTAWKSTPAANNLGRIFGQVAFIESNTPVVNALVVAGGKHTLTASDGSFLIEGLPPGIHNMVVYSLDGAFQPFQQGAVIADGSTTPALVQIRPSKMVNITFLVNPPQDGLDGIPIRLVGNTISLGNTFSDLKGGVNVLASRAPVMRLMPDGRYELSLKLPAGGDLRYKYTLGDGYWNAERNTNGTTRIRQMIVPEKDTTIEDQIETWRSGGQGPVSYNVVVAGNIPASDTLSIQFNPFGWTEPVPMWPAGDRRWFYVLYDPLSTVSGATYRYCRNDQCGTADLVETSGLNAQGKLFPAENAEPTIEEEISSWAWMDIEAEPVIVPATEINPRESNFQAGVTLMPGYHPGWQAHLGPAFQNIRDIGANAVILTPSWHVTHQSPPVIELLPGSDPLWLDLTQMIGQAQQNNLQVSIHPVLSYSDDSSGWWNAAERDEDWWQSWFDRYQTFILYHADLATQTGAKALILGDESILAALPGGTLQDGSPSGAPEDAGERWKKLITNVRARYNGKLIWFVPYADELPNLPDFVNAVDQLYVQISPPFLTGDKGNFTDLEQALSTRLDEDILQLQEKTNQPLVLGLLYPSVSGMKDGCAGSTGDCLTTAQFRQPAPVYAGSELSLQEQSDAYSALLSIINRRSWISGFFAVDYYLPVGLIDMSTSVRGKSASDILWYWYPRLLGQEAP